MTTPGSQSVPYEKPVANTAEAEWSYRLQVASLAAVLVLFVAVAAIGWHAWLTLTAGVVLSAGSGLISRRLGVREEPGREPLVVWMIGNLGIILPAAVSSEDLHTPFAIWALGGFSVLGFWAVHRYPVTARPVNATPVAVAVRRGAKVGLRAALVIDALISVAVLLRALGPAGIGESVSAALAQWALIVAAFAVGLVTAGAVVGALMRLVRWPVGAMATGVVGGALAWGFVNAALGFLGDQTAPKSVPEAVGAALTLGLYAGPVLALLVKGSVRQRSRPVESGSD